MIFSYTFYFLDLRILVISCVFIIAIIIFIIIMKLNNIN